MLSFLLLGSPQLILDEHPLVKLRPKHRALIYYLAARGETLSRDHLLSFFWPDSDRQTGQHTLRTLLYDLRKILASAIVVEDDTISLSPQIQVDTGAFKAGLSAAADFESLNR